MEPSLRIAPANARRKPFLISDILAVKSSPNCGRQSTAFERNAEETRRRDVDSLEKFRQDNFAPVEMQLKEDDLDKNSHTPFEDAQTNSVITGHCSQLKCDKDCATNQDRVKIGHQSDSRGSNDVKFSVYNFHNLRNDKKCSRNVEPSLSKVPTKSKKRRPITSDIRADSHRDVQQRHTPSVSKTTKKTITMTLSARTSSSPSDVDDVITENGVQTVNLPRMVKSVSDVSLSNQLETSDISIDGYEAKRSEANDIIRNTVSSSSIQRDHEHLPQRCMDDKVNNMTSPDNMTSSVVNDGCIRIRSGRSSLNHVEMCLVRMPVPYPVIPTIPLLNFQINGGRLFPYPPQSILPSVGSSMQAGLRNGRCSFPAGDHRQRTIADNSNNDVINQMDFHRARQYSFFEQATSSRTNLFGATNNGLFASSNGVLFGGNIGGIRRDSTNDNLSNFHTTNDIHSSFHSTNDIHSSFHSTNDIHSSFHLNMKCRRNRTVYSEHHLTCLEDHFDRQKYLTTKDRILLAGRLGLTQIQVKTWYQNRRMKWKKQVLQDGGTQAPTKPKGRPKKLDEGISPETAPD